MLFTSKARQHRRRLWALATVLARVLTLLLALQFSGTVHDLSDAVQVVVAADDTQHETCPPNGPCDDCPPGCPNCHCAAVSSTVPEVRLDFAPYLLPASLLPCLQATQAVAAPDRPALFRPPRA